MTESEVESAALDRLKAIGWEIAHVPDISLGGDTLTLALSQWSRTRTVASRMPSSSPMACREWFKPWCTITGETLAQATMPELPRVIEGLFAKRHSLDLVRDFCDD